jgi:hypothetical protein
MLAFQLGSLCGWLGVVELPYTRNGRPRKRTHSRRSARSDVVMVGAQMNLYRALPFTGHAELRMSLPASLGPLPLGQRRRHHGAQEEVG